MKKKSIIVISAVILAIIATTITLFLVFGKERVNVKIVELPKEIGEFKLGSRTPPEFVETVERMDEILAWQYLTKKDEETRKEEALKELKSQTMFFGKYNAKYFNENFVFFTANTAEYSGYVGSIPDIKKKKSYVSKDNKLIIEVEITNEPTKNPFKLIALFESNLTDPHGFIIEIPRKQFEKYNMTYDDIEIVYLNSHDTRYNVQYGGDKYRLDPNYPQPIGFDYSKLKD